MVKMTTDDPLLRSITDECQLHATRDCFKHSYHVIQLEINKLNMTSCGIYIFKGSEVDPRETWVMLHESAIYDSSEKMLIMDYEIWI